MVRITLIFLRKLKYIIIFITCLSFYLSYKVVKKVHMLDFERNLSVIQIGLPTLNMNMQNLNNDDSFLINTTGCKIPRSDTINDRILPLMNNSLLDEIPQPYCHYVRKTYRPPLIASQGNTLYIIHNYVKFYTKLKPSKIKCYYKPFWKAGPDNGKYKSLGKAVRFINSTTIPSTVEFISVRCKTKRGLIYRDFHAFVPQKQTTYISLTSSQVNVLVFGMDALSRVNFHRQMPLTERVLEKLNFIEYLGYTKLADNTFPNLIPLLSGYSVSELRRKCWRYRTSHFDKCPFIWKKYKQHNYTTAFIEEQHHLSLFRFERAGFMNSPTDYYYYTFDRAISDAMGHTRMSASDLCLGPRLSAQILLDYSFNVISALKHTPLFSFIWEVSLSHDDLNLPRASDTMHEKFFNSLNDLGVTETSVIIFMGDHGMRHGKILELFEGYLEERLPLFTASFPSWFPGKYPLAYANFVANSRRLTTHFDAHETLNDLVDLNYLEDDVIRRRTIQLNQLRKIPRGISLFLPIPQDRTCEQAEIPYTYCTCMQTQDETELDTSFALEVGEFLVYEVNQLIEKYDKCAKLELQEVKKIQFITMNDKRDFIQATVHTEPGNGIFQALIRYTDEAQSEMEIDGDITRMSKYGNQSWCMNEPEMKLYCYCV
ncbi:uncharacterized protein LOC135836776 [Planococcus citri]|uniref:uncharacterized protein LOC135836776 n=1 Tax=Planococcus citri TaxID=170843 RepID=UPI0031F86304